MRDLRLLESLLARGGDPDLAPGGTPLLITAALADKFDAIWRLVDAGADIDARDGMGQSVLLVLARTKAWDQVVEALNRGADWRIEDRTGQTLEQMVDNFFDTRPNPPAAYWDVVDKLRSLGATLRARRPTTAEGQ